MSTHRTLSWAIPGTAREILTRCEDPDVARRRAECDTALRARVSHLRAGDPDSPDDPALVFEVTGQIPQEWIPSAVASRLASHSGGSGRPGITRRETWYLHDDDSAHALVAIDLSGIPATRVGAAARLAPQGRQGSQGSQHSHGCTLTYELDLDVSVPFLGSTIERAVLSQIAAALDKEARVIQSS